MKLREQWGFVPNLLQREPLPEQLASAVSLIDAVLFKESTVPRMSKELILMTLAVATGNTYWVGIHLQVLLLMGMPEDTVLAAARDFRTAPLGDNDKALLKFAVEAATLGRYSGSADERFTDAVALVGLSIYLNAVTKPADPVPDFGPWTHPSVPAPDLCDPSIAIEPLEPLIERAFTERPVLRDTLWRAADVALLRGQFPKTDFPATTGSSQTICDPDPDGALVASARKGDTKAFEELVHKHGRRVYRTLAGILGDQEEARDVMQDTFLKAFRRLNSFEGRSRFSTWLITIGTNAAIEKLRERRPTDSLDEGLTDGEGAFRPRLLQAWGDSPEQRYGKLQMKELVQREVRRLPVAYRAAVVLRDIEELSTREAAEVLGLEVPTLKSRLLRGRLLLREALSPHFASTSKGALA